MFGILLFSLSNPATDNFMTGEYLGSVAIVLIPET